MQSIISISFLSFNFLIPFIFLSSLLALSSWELKPSEVSNPSVTDSVSAEEIEASVIKPQMVVFHLPSGIGFSPLLTSFDPIKSFIISVGTLYLLWVIFGDIYDVIGIEIIAISKTTTILILLFSWVKKKNLLSILHGVYTVFKIQRRKKNH